MKCPCNECICLAMCKCKIRIYPRKQTGTFMSILRCQILGDYLKQKVCIEYENEYRKRVDKTRIVYGLKPLFKGRCVHGVPV